MAKTMRTKAAAITHSRWEVTLRNLRALKLRIKVLSQRVSYQEQRLRQLERRVDRGE